MNCEGRKGFLTLANCENPAMTACSNCGRMMCTIHLAPQSGFTMCHDCAATNPQYQQEGEYDDTWAAGYRSSYYNDTGYEPVSGFSHHDRSSFTSRTRNVSEDETETGGFDAS